MSDLTGNEIKDTYKDLLHMSNGNTGVTTDLARVFDGEGTGSALSLSTDAVSIGGSLNVQDSLGIGTSPTKPLEVAQANGNAGLRLNYLPDQYKNQYNADLYYDGVGALKIESWAAGASQAGNIVLGNNGGNVGIGTSEPTEGKLVIDDGAAVIKSSGPVLVLKDKDGGDVNSQNGYISYRDNSNTERGYVGFGGSNNKNLTVSNNIGDIILHGGNVGIGTNPARLLHLRNDDSAIAFETPIDADGSAFAQIKSGRDGNSGYSSTLEFATTESATAVPTFGGNGTGGSGFVTRMLIDSAGNVGIGTDPSYKLDVDVQGVGLRLNNSTAAAVDESNETPSIILQANGWDDQAGSRAYSARIRAFGTYSADLDRKNTYPTISFDLETNENLPDDNLTPKMQIGIDQVTVPTGLAIGGAVLDKVILAGSESPQALALAADGTVAFNKRDADGGKVGLYFSPGGSADHPHLNLYDKDGNHGTKISSADDSFFNVQGGSVGIGDSAPTDNDHLALSLKAKGDTGTNNTINQDFKNSNGHIFNFINHREETIGASWILKQLAFANYSYGEPEHVGIVVANSADATNNSRSVTILDGGGSHFKNFMAGRQIQFLDGDNVVGTYTVNAYSESGATKTLTLVELFTQSTGQYAIRMVPFYVPSLSVLNRPNGEGVGSTTGLSPKVGIGVEIPEENLHVRSTAYGDTTGVMIDRLHHNSDSLHSGGFITTRSDPTSGGLVFGAKISNANHNVFEYNSVPLSASGGTTFALRPVSTNLIDLGSTDKAWRDVYVKDGTVENSDKNLKQDIEELSETEELVAKKCKKLLRKYRWKDSVLEKGDDARIHFGIIAQDLEDAFQSEGLDAGDYGMFIKNTWWEKERVIPAVEAVEAVDAVYDEEDNLISPAVEAVEAKDEETVIETFYNKDEAPEGSEEKTRRGVRYSELLAFIISAI